METVDKAVTLEGTVVDVVNGVMGPGSVTIWAGRIIDVQISSGPARGPFLVPGFVDAHVHIESSMLGPREFGRMAAIHGTVAAVTDPHEIANVLGVQGVEFMLEEASRAAIRIATGAPSCVPATEFETSGARLDAAAVAALLARSDISHLSEVMNFPGVLAGNPDLTAKIAAARSHGKPVDGHAPGLRGKQARDYFTAGISTDHECCDLDEALDKIGGGVWILIREGSAARNFEALHPLLCTHPDRCMFCCDDIHPDHLVERHIDRLLARAVASGAKPMHVLRAASLNPIRHYDLATGLLQPGDRADFAIVEDLVDFRVLATFQAGTKVAEEGRSLLEPAEPRQVNFLRERRVAPDEFRVQAGTGRCRVIEARSGELTTRELTDVPRREGRWWAAAPERDLLKIAVVNRYAEAEHSVGFVRGFGLKRGAIASSVAHDSHNVVAVGSDDEELARAVNAVFAVSGGICAISGDRQEVLPLPIAGLMSGATGPMVAVSYNKCDQLAKQMGSTLQAPFMTLSFMALLVIPELKLSDRGLFSSGQFELVRLEIE